MFCSLILSICVFSVLIFTFIKLYHFYWPRSYHHHQVKLKKKLSYIKKRNFGETAERGSLC